MSHTAHTAGFYDGQGRAVLVASTTRPALSAPMGDRARLRSLVAWGERTGLSMDAVAFLDADEVRVDCVMASRLADQLRRAGQALRDLPVPGLVWEGAGIIGGTMGENLTMGGGQLLVADGPATVTAHVNGAEAFLQVRSQGGACVSVSGWEPNVSGGVLVSGEPVSSAVASALSSLSSSAVLVRAVPATSVAAGLLVTLMDLALQAAKSMSSLHVRAQRPGPT